MMPHSKDYEKIVKTFLDRSVFEQDHFADALTLSSLISNLFTLEEYLQQRAYTLKREPSEKLKEINELVSDLLVGMDCISNEKEAQRHA